MPKSTRVQAQHVRRGDKLLTNRPSVRVPQIAKFFKSDNTHVWINNLKFDPTELVRIERNNAEKS
jgi:hypothetical protein